MGRGEGTQDLARGDELRFSMRRCPWCSEVLGGCKSVKQFILEYAAHAQECKRRRRPVSRA